MRRRGNDPFFWKESLLTIKKTHLSNWKKMLHDSHCSPRGSKALRTFLPERHKHIQRRYSPQSPMGAVWRFVMRSLVLPTLKLATVIWDFCGIFGGIYNWSVLSILLFCSMHSIGVSLFYSCSYCSLESKDKYLWAKIAGEKGWKEIRVHPLGKIGVRRWR